MMTLSFMLASLDRCPHGRHQSDVCGECGPERQPNDRLDEVAGYGIGGHPITVRDIYEGFLRAPTAAYRVNGG